MALKKKRIGELDGSPIVIGKKNYVSENEYYMTLNGDNTYQKLEKRVNGDNFKTILGGSSKDNIYLGSFSKENLPVLGEDDYGKLASIDGEDSVYWNGSEWVYLNGNLVNPRYLTFTANEDGSGVGFIIFNDGYTLPETYTSPSLQYSIDGGVTWDDYDLQISDDVSNASLINLDEGESVMFKGVNDNLACYIQLEDGVVCIKTYIEGSIAASGDVTSLLNGLGGDVAVPQYCYSDMFNSCAGLTIAPALPSTTLADYCYQGMFNSCTSLTEAPTLPATTLAVGCYFSMFTGCTCLTSAPALPATTLANGCYYSMFYNCTGLTQAPVLPATTLDDYCYEFMFKGCTAIPSHDVATLNDSQSTFSDNSSCASFTIHDDTPPTIASNTITGLKADCIIYVPVGSAAAYKVAQYWSARADYIQEIP